MFLNVRTNEGKQAVCFQMVGTWYEFKWYSGKLDQFKSWFVRRKCSKQVYEYVSGEIEQLSVTISDMKS